MSLQPPLVQVCVDHAASMYEALQHAERFGVNILASEQEALSRRFAAVDSSHRFDGIGYVRAEAERPSRLEERLVAPEESIDLRLDLPKAWEALTPEMRELWRLLFEEEGNTSSVAKRLGRPRKTVEYWIRNLRTFFKNCGIE